MFCVVRYGFLSVVLFLSFFSNGYDYPFGISTFSLHGIFLLQEHRQIQRQLYYIVIILVVDGIEMVHT